MDAHWRFLEDHADRENVQEHIRREIQRGTIRVIPGPGGIRIVPQLSDERPDNAPLARLEMLIAKATLTSGPK